MILRIHVVREEIDEYFKQRASPRTDGQKFGQVCQCNLSKKKDSTWAEAKPKLDTARKVRGVYNIDPEEKEFNVTLKMRDRSWKCIWTLQCRVNCERLQGIHSVGRRRTHKREPATSNGK